MAEALTVDSLTEMLRDPEAFEKFFKKEAAGVNFGTGEWKLDQKTKSHRLSFPDGSYVRVKFFNTIKKIFNIKTNIEEPGRESLLSYIDVVVMPAGVKGYSFKHFNAQHVMGYAPASAQEKHVVSINRLVEFSTNLGIDLTQEGAWETYYAGK